MKPETLKGLLIDRALDELEPETAELLEAYLAQDPRAAVDAAAWARTWELSRFASTTPANRQEDQANRRDRGGGFPASLRAPLRARSWVRQERLRLAACLVVGVGLGWLAASLDMSPPDRERRRAEVRETAAGRFWSLGYLAQERAGGGTPSRQPHTLRWDPRAGMPHLEKDG